MCSGPTYVNMTIGSFVCTKCSGMLRGINPPHRIKSISMSSFTSEEVEMVRSKGNIVVATRTFTSAKPSISTSNVALKANPGTVLESARPEDSKTPPTCSN